MTDNTINNDLTMGGGANGTLLAGRYRVVRQLGQGGMGSVWLAEDLKLDGHKVAVKMLPSILVSNKRAYNQLKSEALVALKLTHPNIATVRAFEENEGNPFLVMDYIDGLTLDEYLAKKGKLSEETTYCLLEPVARALDYAHERGIVHRDVKPGNVMVTWDGDPFVLDFGIAREIQETMTRVTGKLSSGTLLYMSPEQLRGAAPKPAQDVYSFATLAYECLRGEPPFSRGQVEWQILNGAPEPLPADIAMGPRVMAGLAKKPEDRPPSCLAIMRGGWKPADGGGTHAEKPKSEAEETTSAPRTKAPKAVAPKPEAESPLVAQIRERWKLLALVGVSLLTVIALVSSQSTASSPSGRSVPTEVVETGDDSKPEAKPAGIDAKYVDVGVLVGRVERLDRADGFAAKIDALVDVQNRARSHYELQKWTAAAKLFDEAEAAAKELLELGRLREQAKSAAHRADRAATGAEAANARQLAAALWNQAVEERDRAKGEFGTQRFTDAAESYGRVEKLFADAETTAKSEGARRENKAKEDALRKQAIKEVCDLRSACEQSRWQAEKAGASEFAAKEMTTAMKLLADADRASENDRKQAYQIAQKAFEHARQIAMEAAKPKLTLKAMLNGAEVSAKIVSGLEQNDQETPVSVDLSGLGLGTVCVFDLVYHLDGVAYKGHARYLVKRGTHELVVELVRVIVAPEKKPLTDAERLVGRWEGRYVRTCVHDGEQMPPNAPIDEKFVFGADGTVSHDVDYNSQYIPSTSRLGTWTFENGRLHVVLGTEEVEYRVVWHGTDRFELRYANLERYARDRKTKMSGYTDLRAYYDSVGRLVLSGRYKGLLGLSSAQTTWTDPPHIFSRN